MIAVREFTPDDDLAAHYKAVRERIRNARPKPAPLRLVTQQPKPVPLPPAPRDFLHVATCAAPGARIISEVCQKYGVTLNDIKSARRSQYLAIPRQEICYRLRRETGLSFPQMGKMLNRDHSTQLHSARKYEQRLANGEVSL